MNKKLYSKLALTNLKKNSLMLLPYIITCIVTIALFYTMNSLVNDTALKNIPGGNFTIDVMKFGSLLFTNLSLFFLLYANSFIFKRRKKEFGLYHLLGMEKKHVRKLLRIENFLIALMTTIGGLTIGLILNQVVGIAMSITMNVPLTLKIFSIMAILKTLVTFSIIFIIIYLYNLKQLNSVRITELMKGGQIGEREPKAKYVLAVLGGILLISGYLLSFMVSDPILDLNAIIAAIVFVVAATYLLFTAVSIVLLKMLQKNESFYYNKDHFTLISTMLYRMKQNAVGLSNIAVLSTATMIVMTTTVSLYLGVNTMVNNTFQFDVSITNAAENVAEQQQLQTFIDNHKERYDVEITSLSSYRGGQFAADLTGDGKEEFFRLLPLEDFNSLTNENISLASDEVLLLKGQETADLQSITLNDQSFNVKDTVEELPIDTSLAKSIEGNWVYVVAALTGEFVQSADLENSLMMYQDINLQGESDSVNEFSHAIADEAETIGNVYIEAKSIYRETVLGTFGGLLFLGIFISVVLFAETALMIYFKQISEGHDDRHRFTIMRKVGIGDKEITQTIRRQTLIMFLAPLTVAIIHLAAIMPLVMKIIGTTAAMDHTLVVLGSALFAAFLFTIVYGVIFRFTEKNYQRIIIR
ncbi:FtsX-like permease family protein [Bacillus mesophilum]|uniref:ABC transporter permease n=1 Tax=Bacillus mesophilum TaxID=1071718 RepID=A0A7V7UUH6_9BACI|nr:ABC transporter permease [Bacillus mesophilum]KAB2331262.1 ABC transporter permease [Bacillus mesophilum]